jgi:AcrR family transcriptional regulator
MSVTERLPLTRERIVAAAVVLADENGVDALSMRKLGAALGVEAMSLYNHVANKEDLLDAVLDAILLEMDLPDPDGPWDDQLRAIAHAFRRVGHAHPRIFPLFGSRSIRSVDGFRPLEQSYAAIRKAGLPPDEAFDAFGSLAAYVFGYVLTELEVVDLAEGALTAALGRPPVVGRDGTGLLQRDGDRSRLRPRAQPARPGRHRVSTPATA